MDDRPTVRQVVYTHSVLEGSAYEIGRQQGEHIRNSPAARFFTSPSPERGPLTPRQAEEAIRFFDKHCPGLNEEIQGFADRHSRGVFWRANAQSMARV